MKTLKVPKTQFRAAKLEITGEGDQRKFSMSISSDTPYERYDWFNDEPYFELLSHAPGDINEERLKAGLPVLFNHSRDLHLGRAGNYVNDGHKCTLLDIKFSESDFAQEKLRDAVNGVLPDTSVGYTIEDEGECIGEKDGIPIYKFRWNPYEGSLVTVAADISVGVGRDATRVKPPEDDLREILIREKSDSQIEIDVDRNANPPQKRESSSQIANKNMETITETPEQKSAREAQEKQQRQKEIVDGVKAATERQTEIRAIAQRATNLPAGELEKALGDSVENEHAVEAFRKLVFEKYFGTPKALRTPNIEIIGDRSDAMTLGQRFVQSEQYKSIQHARGQGRKIASLELDEEFNFRANFTTASVTGYSGIIAAPQINLIGVQRPTVADLLAQGTTNLSAVPFVREDAFTNAATGVAQGGDKPEATFALTQTSAPVRKIAVTIPVTDEAFEDIATLASYIDNRLRYSVEMEEERQLLNGSTSAEVTGILQTSGIQTQAKGGDTTIDAIRKARNLKIRALGFAEPTGIIFHPNDWDDIEGAKDANNQYYSGGPFTGSYGQQFAQVQRIWGMTVVVTTSMTENTALIVTGMDAMIFRKKGITIDSTNSHASEFIANITRLRGEERLALALFRPKSFCTVTGI